jgi:transcriptional antiterminator NusG
MTVSDQRDQRLDQEQAREQLKEKLAAQMKDLSSETEAPHEQTPEPVTIQSQESSDHVTLDSAVKWYVVHTYSGYENKVKANIEKIIENRGMQDVIEQVVVPVQDTIEIKNGQKKSVQRKIYPGYVLLKMVMNEDTWYVVRNTRGVTSFVGPASKPVPLTDEEIITMGVEIPDFELDLNVDELVRIITGPFEGSIGNVREVNAQKKTVTLALSVFGRETQVELDYHVLQRM